MVTKQSYESDVFSRLRYFRIILQTFVDFFMSQRNRFILKTELNQRLPLMKYNMRPNSVGTRIILEICYEFFFFNKNFEIYILFKIYFF